MKLFKFAAVAAATSVLGLSSAMAADYTLRVQTHYAPETVSGKLAQQFVDDVETMSGGRLDIEMFFASSVVKSVETFDAAATGILDCDMTGGAYQTGKNPAFQFVGDIMGGYDDAIPAATSWLYYGGGYDAAQCSSTTPMTCSSSAGGSMARRALSSTKPIAGPADFKDWKFRSPPGLETEIMANLGAKPIVMDFTEIFTALETGIIDGADASGIANNKSAWVSTTWSTKYANFPGFHSMPSDHLAMQQGRSGTRMPEHRPAAHHGHRHAEAGACRRR